MEPPWFVVVCTMCTDLIPMVVDVEPQSCVCTDHHATSALLSLKRRELRACLATSRRGRFAMLRHRMSRRRDLGPEMPR